MGPQLEKMMKAMHQEMPVQKKILEINPSHALTAALRSLQAKEPDRLAEYAEVLYDEALLLAQQPIENPIAFAKMTTELLARSIEGELK
jgi:molecular chaperone HtpG